MTYRIPFIALLALALLAVVPPAAADDAASAPALEQLTPDERRVLDERVEGFADLPAKGQEKIAANVIRLRALEGEERTRFLERVRAVERHRERHGRLPSGLDAARNPKRRDAIRRRGFLVRAVGQPMWAALSPEARARIKTTLGRRGRGAVEIVFAQRLVAAEARALAEGQGPIEVPTPVSPPLRRRIRQLSAQAEGGDAKARLRLAKLVVGLRSQELQESMPKAFPADGATLRSIGERVQASDPDLFARAVQDLERAAASDEGLERYARSAGVVRETARRGKLQRLRKALEDARPALEGDPRLRGPADRLDRALGQALERGKRRP